MKKIGKRLIPAIVSAVLLLTAAGCQNGAGTAPATTNQPPASVTSQDSTTGEEGATRKVQTIKGEIEVLADPKRVVVNWYIGDVLALDLDVVGYYCWEQEAMPFYDRMMATTKIENWEPEEVMALEPDLIVTYKEEDFDTFKGIAPVLVVKGSEMSPIERVQFLGEATGRTEEAQEAVGTFETKLADAKELLSGDWFAGKTFTINEDWGSSGAWAGIAFEGSSRGGTLVYKFLGMTMPDNVQALVDESSDRDYALLSYEVSHEYFGDYIIWFDQEGTESEYKKTEIWNSIPAVVNGNIITIPGEKLGLFYYSDILSLTAEIDYIVDAINAMAN